MTEIYEYAVALPLGLSVIVGFAWLSYYVTYRVAGEPHINTDEDRFGMWTLTLAITAPVLFGLGVASIALGRFLLERMFD